jgi:hypothetical protein
LNRSRNRPPTIRNDRLEPPAAPPIASLTWERNAMQFSYDVVSHNGGWAIVITPEHPHGGFPTKQSAFDAAVEFARKLRFVGYSVNVHVHHQQPLKKAANM